MKGAPVAPVLIYLMGMLVGYLTGFDNLSLL